MEQAGPTLHRNTGGRQPEGAAFHQHWQPLPFFTLLMFDCMRSLSVFVTSVPTSLLLLLANDCNTGGRQPHGATLCQLLVMRFSCGGS
jgi:hypothetical protein